MARTDIHLDAMLRHLGAAYYESLHGRAARSDVTRALDTVEEHLREQSSESAGAAQPSPQGTGPAVPPARKASRAETAEAPHRRRYARRVRDVMTTDIITIDRITPYKEIARRLAEHRISGMPVLTMGRHVAGVVSEADLLAAEDKHARKVRTALTTEDRHGLRLWGRHPEQPVPLVAGDLMSSPAVTIHPDATIPAAARVMNTHRIRRLPVVDPDGKLIGLVSRRDLLSVFLRPDTEIAGDAQLILDEVLLAGLGGATVSVHDGVVTLSGTLHPAEGEHTDLIPVAIRLIWDIDGVVEVVNRMTQAQDKPEPEAEEAS